LVKGNWYIFKISIRGVGGNWSTPILSDNAPSDKVLVRYPLRGLGFMVVVSGATEMFNKQTFVQEKVPGDGCSSVRYTAA
jgi:hypothetical protein